MTLSKAINEFRDLRSLRGSTLTTHRYDKLLRIFCMCLHDPDVESIDLPHILWYLSELGRLGWKPNGINLIALGIRKFFEFCNLRGYTRLNENLVPLPKKEFNIPRVADVADVKKMLRHLPASSSRPHHIRNRALLMLIWDTGARVGEILSLDVSDLDLKGRTAVIRTEKSRGRRPVRQIYWTPATAKALLRWIKKKRELQSKFEFKDEDALFISISKCAQYDMRGRRMTGRGAAETFRMLSNLCGIPVVNPHSLRHAMGRDVARVLRSNSAVSNVLGHSSLDSSYIYTMLWGDDLKEDWQQVARSRGQIGKIPQFGVGFPALKRPSAVVKGQFKSVNIKTSKFGRYVHN